MHPDANRGHIEVSCSSSEPCSFSSGFFQHAIKDAERLRSSYFGDKVFLSQCGEVEVSGTPVTWEGTARTRTRAQGLRRLTQADGAPCALCHLAAWMASLGALGPRGPGEAEQLCVPGEQAVLSRHQQNNWEK